MPVPYHKKLICQMPLGELWNDAGPVAATRQRHPTDDDIRELLRSGGVRFVVANVGDKLRWIDAAETYRFWKSEVRPHLCCEGRGYLDDYPDHYFYFASEWHLETGESAILLEQQH